MAGVTEEMNLEWGRLHQYDRWLLHRTGWGASTTGAWKLDCRGGARSPGSTSGCQTPEHQGWESRHESNDWHGVGPGAWAGPLLYDQMSKQPQEQGLTRHAEPPLDLHAGLLAFQSATHHPAGCCAALLRCCLRSGRATFPVTPGKVLHRSAPPLPLL